MSRKVKTALGWIVVLVLALAVLHVSTSRAQPHRQESFSTFLRHVEADQVLSVTIRGSQLVVVLRDSGEEYATVGMVDEDVVKELSERGSVVAYEEDSKSFLSSWGVILIPIALLVLLFAYIARQAKNPGGVMSLGKSRARRIAASDVTFDAVGGLGDAKERFGDVIDFLKNPKRWIDAGVRLPRGVLLVGPPGCGKTLLARAAAGESGVPFFSVSASEFVEVFVGVGAARIRDMFEEARKAAPALIFIDELDAVGRRRGSGVGTSHDEREHTLNQLLAALDGFEPNEQVVVIAATNRPDVLDSALLRPGRFDVRMAVGPPDQSGRLQMLRIHTRNKRLADDVSLEALAERTPGYSGADLESLANEAALLAVREVGGTGSPDVSMAHFERALESTRITHQVFDQLDAVLIESASQVSQPTGDVVVRVTLEGGATLEGRVSWADGHFVKLSRGDAGGDVVLSKEQIRHVEALAGTTAVAAGEIVADRWSQRVVDAM